MEKKEWKPGEEPPLTPSLLNEAASFSVDIVPHADVHNWEYLVKGTKILLAEYWWKEGCYKLYVPAAAKIATLKTSDLIKANNPLKALTAINKHIRFLFMACSSPWEKLVGEAQNDRACDAPHCFVHEGTYLEDTFEQVVMRLVESPAGAVSAPTQLAQRASDIAVAIALAKGALVARKVMPHNDGGTIGGVGSLLGSVPMGSPIGQMIKNLMEKFGPAQEGEKEGETEED
jgi:hypothetical protein